jgi:hypothetical protein
MGWVPGWTKVWTKGGFPSHPEKSFLLLPMGITSQGFQPLPPSTGTSSLQGPGEIETPSLLLGSRPSNLDRATPLASLTASHGTSQAL